MSSEAENLEDAISSLEQTCYVIETGLARVGLRECQITVSAEDVANIRAILGAVRILARGGGE